MADRIRAAACEVARLQNRSLADWLYRVALDYAAERAIPCETLTQAQIVEAVSLRLESLCRHIFDIDLESVHPVAAPAATRDLDEAVMSDRHLLDRAIGQLMERASVEGVSPAAHLATGAVRRTSAKRPTRIDSRQMGSAVAAAVKRRKQRGPEEDGGEDLLRLCDEIENTLGAYRARRNGGGDRSATKAPRPSVDPVAEQDLRPSLAPSDTDCSDDVETGLRAETGSQQRARVFRRVEDAVRRSKTQSSEFDSTSRGGNASDASTRVVRLFEEAVTRARAPAADPFHAEPPASHPATSAADGSALRTQAMLGRLERQYEDLSVGFSSIRDIHSRVATLDDTVRGFLDGDARRARDLEARAAASAQRALEKVLSMLQAPKVSEEHTGLLRRTVDVLDNLSERVDDTARRMSALESRLAEPGASLRDRAAGSRADNASIPGAQSFRRAEDTEKSGRPGAAPNAPVKPRIKIETAQDPRQSLPRRGPVLASSLAPEASVRKTDLAVEASEAAARARPHAHLGWSLGMGLAATAVAVGSAAYLGTPRVLADSPVVAAADAHEPEDAVRVSAGDHQASRSSDAAQPPETARPTSSPEHEGAMRAADLFEEATAYETGRGGTRDPARAVALFQEAADLGSIDAKFHLGTLFERGVGVSRDLAHARALYLDAANGGHAGAMHNLAVLLFATEGDANLPAAMSWFQRAAQAGVRDSQYNLGVLYSNGRGAPRSLLEAYRWFALAAAQGDPEAAKKRDIVAAQLSPGELRAARGRVAAFTPDGGRHEAVVAAAGS